MKLADLIEKLNRQRFSGEFKAASANRKKKAWRSSFEESRIGFMAANPDAILIFEMGWDEAIEWMINELRLNIEDGAGCTK